MKPIASIVCLVLLVSFVTGCKQESPPAPAPPPETESVPTPEVPPVPPPVTGEDVKKEVGEAAETTGKYLAEKRDQLVASAKAKLDDLEVRTAELKDEFDEKSKEWSAEAKAAWERSMVELEEQKEAAKVKLAELREKSGPLLEKAGQEFEEAADKAVGLFHKLKAKIAGEQAPPSQPEK